MNTNQKVQENVALLLNPEEILELNTPFDSLHIIRKDKTLDFDRYPVSEHEIKSFYKYLPPEARESLHHFIAEYLAFEISQIRKRRAKEKGGAAPEVFVQKAALRHINECMDKLAVHQESFRLYHRVRNPDTGNFRIASCMLSTVIPRLSFEVVQDEKGALFVSTIVHISGKEYNLHELTRFLFLVLHEDVYYRFRHEDYLTLSWLEEKNPGQYSLNPSELSQKILLRLEEKYTVCRNNLFDRNEIRTAPVNCVFLSEISGSFLMLTPRWNYEGFMAEGTWKPVHETTKNGDLYTIYRDQSAETDFFDFLKSLHPNFQKQINGFFYLSFADAKKKQWFLKVYHQLLDLNIAIIGLDMLQHFRYSQFSADTELRIEKQTGQTLHLHMKVMFGQEEAPLHELRKLLLEKQHAILLKDNTIGVLTEEWLAQYGPIIKHGQISKNKIDLPQWILLSNQYTEDSLRPILPDEWQKRWLHWQQEAAALYTIPDTVQARLRPYQQKGFEWMVLLSEISAGSCLADDMGLGKTLQTISFLAWRKQEKPAGKQLIACPASLIYNWKQELEKFAPSLKVFIYNGPQRNLEHFATESADIIICSYGTLRSDIDLLRIMSWDVVILDESQNIKNLSAQVTNAVYQLTAQCRIALSGTPVMNQTFDLYAQLNFLLPGLLGGQEFFRKEYANPIDRDHDKEKIKALQQLTAPFILRRTKEEVAKDLPPKIETVLWCEMGTEQKAAYEEIKNSIRDSLFLGIKNDGIGKNKLGILQGIQKLRQICGAPQLLHDETISTTESVKVEVLMEELKNLKGNKALVFSQFKGMLHLIAEQCRKENIAYYHFDGDTAVAERMQMVNQFQQDENDVRVFLISLKAGNAGITLTAADYVFLVDPWWNTAVQQQAIDRTHRIGQDKSVFAYKLICKDTIEEKIIRLQERKHSLSAELINEEDGFVKNLTEEDIKYLFD